jgi:hypothetical protein
MKYVLISILKQPLVMDFKCVSVVLYECETWHLTVREEDRLRMSEGRVLMRILEPTRKEVMGSWKSCIMRNFIICDVHKTILEQNQE